MPRMLIGWRVDATWDVARQRRRGKTIRQLQSPEARRDWIEHGRTECAHCGERRLSAWQVVERNAAGGRQAVPRLTAFDELTVNEVLTTPFVEIHAMR